MRAAGESTRLRLLALLDRADLTVTDLVNILGQSQPRISRHLKLLVEAGLAERFQEGAFAYFRAVQRGGARRFLDTILTPLDPNDEQLATDADALSTIRARRAEKAQSYFSANAEQWNRIRSLHVSEENVETAMLELALTAPLRTMLDLGTGTGRVLELFAPHIERGVGVDASADMLSLARTALGGEEFGHIQVQRGDVYSLDISEAFDLVVLHQVLHFLEEPDVAISQAAERLAPNGRMLIVDFAPHEFDFLRDEHAHHRLGFSTRQVSRWLGEVGLDVEEVRSMDAEEGEADALTVMLWLAGR